MYILIWLLRGRLSHGRFRPIVTIAIVYEAKLKQLDKVSGITPKNKSAAPGQYLGYSLQQVRLCSHLLQVAEKDSVSLEHLDDVAVHYANGSFLLEQDKSALKGNPLADSSAELWKAFANWGDMCGNCDPNYTDYHLYVSPSKEGAIASAAHAASTVADAMGVLKQIKALCKGKKPDSGCVPFVNRFLSIGDERCVQIILRFHLAGEDDPLEGIRMLLRSALPPDTLDHFCACAIGMAKNLADDLIRSGKKPIVVAGEFRRQFRAFVLKHNLSGLLNSKNPEPGDSAIAAMLDTAPLFVRQLSAINATKLMLTTAVSDYLRTAADKIDWASEGLVVAESFDEFDMQLKRKHALIKDEIEDVMRGSSEAERGRNLYRRCSDAQMPLEGRVLPSHFIPGAFNCLADDGSIGWHPDYKKLFPDG